jgi:hypothetical protein
VLAQCRDSADDEDRGAAIGRLFDGRDQLFDRAGDRLLRRQRPVVDDGRRIFRRAAVRDERRQHLRQLLRAGVADDGAVEVRETRPVDRRRRLPVVFVSAHEGQRVAAAGIGGRDARVARDRNPGRDAWHHFEADALFVEEQRLGPAAIEHKWIAPFQARNRLALTRLLRQQVADRFLLERLRRGEADVDLFGVRARVTEQARGHDVVVEDDIRRGEVLQAAHGHQSGISGAGAD